MTNLTPTMEVGGCQSDSFKGQHIGAFASSLFLKGGTPGLKSDGTGSHSSD